MYSEINQFTKSIHFNKLKNNNVTISREWTIYQLITEYSNHMMTGHH